MSYEHFIKTFPHYDFLLPLFQSNKVSYRVWKQDEIICNSDEKLDSIYFFTSGFGKVYRLLSNGKEVLYDLYHGGTIAGDVEYINKKRTECSIKSIEDLSGYLFSINELKKLDKSGQLFKEFALGVVSKLQESSTRSSIKLGYSLEERFAFYLIYEQSTYSLKMFELADILGVTYRHLNRTINKFCEKGLIKMANKKIILLDKVQLEEICETLAEDAF